MRTDCRIALAGVTTVEGEWDGIFGATVWSYRTRNVCQLTVVRVGALPVSTCHLTLKSVVHLGDVVAGLNDGWIVEISDGTDL